MAVVKNPTLNFLLDILLVIAAFALCIWLKNDSYSHLVSTYMNALMLFLFIWVVLSFLFEKYELKKVHSLSHVMGPIIKSNLIAFGLVASLMYVLRISHYSRLIVLGTIGFTTLFELSFMLINYWLKNSVFATEIKNPAQSYQMNGQTTELEPQTTRFKKKDTELLKKREEELFVEIDKEVFNFLFQYANIASESTLILDTTSGFNISSQISDRIDSIVNLKRINDIRFLNKFFEAANHKLNDGGVFIDAVETKNLRKSRILNKFPLPFNYVYYCLDFMLKRVFPKFAFTKKIYFTLTRGQNRVLTKAETFGRLYSCGFEIVAEKEINKMLYFVARKIRKPHYPSNPTYGPFIKLPRIGKDGNLIKVYKLRTMHPFAEYLQEYVYHREGLKEGGKFKDDFRVSTLGRFLRSMWIDELPMFVNFFRGDMKMVGVRPLSEHYFNLYSKELQEKRIQHKPGLIPPFYADCPKSLPEIQESEMRYLEAYEKHPFRTDIKYFFVSVFNIIFHRFRSS